MPQIAEESYENTKVDFGLWKQLLRFAIPYRKNVMAIFIFMVGQSVLDITIPMNTTHLIDNNITPGTMQGAWVNILIYLFCAVMQGINVHWFIRNAGAVEIRVSADIRKAAFRKLQTLSFSYYDVTPVGYIMARMSGDIDRLSDTIAWSMVDLFWSLGFVLIATIWMMIYNYRLTLLLLCVTPALGVLSFILQKYLLKANRQVRQINSKISGAFNEGIMGAKTTKTLVREDANLGEFKALTNSMRLKSIRAIKLNAFYWPAINTILSIGTGLILWKGGIQVLIGNITLGKLVFFIWIGEFFFDPVTNLARIFSNLQGSQAAVERVLKLLNTEPQVQDGAEITSVYGDVFSPIQENYQKIDGDIEFRDVTFAYNTGQEILSDFNLKVRKGQSIALVGPTGAGKSTIVNLICRFYEPTKGQVLIDGVDYRRRSQLWLHSNLGYVLQSPHLFSGTVRENVRYGRPDATDADVEAVCRLIDAHSFIMKLDNGYDTQVGESGGRLSTGEKQLISFARAIIADPAIFVLDEATSSIDAKAEQAIQNAISTIIANRTSFIIAHRLSTIRHSDLILFIDGGRVAERGTHAELMAMRGKYFRLYTEQFIEEQEQSLLHYEAAEAGI